MSEDVKAKDVLIVLGIVAAVIVVLCAALFLFMPISSGALSIEEVEEIENDLPVIKMTDEIFAEYPMLEGPPSGIGIRDTMFSQILANDKKVNPSTAAEIREKFGSAYLDYDGKYYVIGWMVS